VTGVNDVDRERLPSDLSLVSAYGLRRPFWLEPVGTAPRAAVLLVHGFTGTPFEMRLLGEALVDRGYLVYGLKLAGHGVSSDALGLTTYTDWIASVDEALDELKKTNLPICVCGLSLGGLLTLDLARRRGDELVAIASLSAPLWLSRPIELLIAFARRWKRKKPMVALPKGAGSDISEPIMRQRNNLAQGAVGISIPAVLSLHEFMHKVHEELPRIKRPTLAMHSRKDHTAPFACLAAIAKEIGTADIETLTLERSFHVITLDWERDIVVRAVDKHFTRYLK
jgi:carboxylesterase